MRGRQSTTRGRRGAARCAPTNRHRPIPAFAIDYERSLTLRPRCATLTRERSTRDWRGGPSRTRNGLRPGTGRRGPAELWARFDAAVHRLNQAGASDNLSDVVDAYAAVAQAADELADALHAAGE